MTYFKDIILHKKPYDLDYNFYEKNIKSRAKIEHDKLKSLDSSGNVCYLEHFSIGSKEIQKNLYLETFLNIF